MTADTGDSTWADGPFDDDSWDVVLDEAFVNAATFKEQSARARFLASKWSQSAPAPPGWRDEFSPVRSLPLRPPIAPRRGVTLRFLLLVLVVSIGFALGLRLLSTNATVTAGAAGHSAGRLGSPAGEPVVGGAATATYPPGTVSAETGVPAMAPGLPDGATGRPVITMPIAYPKIVQDPAGGRLYTRVGYRDADGCADPALVAPALAREIRADGGCRDFSFSLYTDGDGNQYTVADLTLTTPADAYSLIKWCVMDVAQVDIGPLTPTTGSGLAVLAEGTGTAQTFAASGRVLTVGLASWSDGRTDQTEQLRALFSPLFGAISARAADYEGGNAMVATN